MDNRFGDLILAAHFAWAAWMVLGVLLALAGFVRPRFWRWRVFRTLHLAGITTTATVPLWAAGVCPLTRWEADFSGARASSQPFLSTWLERLLYWDVDPVFLSVLTMAGAVVTVLVYVWHPPWRR